MMKEERKCENCRYFLRHYVQDEMRYIRTDDGHCVNQSLSWREKRKRFGKRYRTACEFWETVEIREEKRKEKIDSVLRVMSERIEEIAMILKQEEE